jgi:hypothetical protein
MAREKPPELTRMGHVASSVGIWSSGAEDRSQTSPKLTPGGSTASNLPKEATAGLGMT